MRNAKFWMAAILLFALPVYAKPVPKPHWVRDRVPDDLVTGDPQWIGHWECLKGWKVVGESDPPGWGKERVPSCKQKEKTQ